MSDAASPISGPKPKKTRYNRLDDLLKGASWFTSRHENPDKYLEEVKTIGRREKKQTEFFQFQQITRPPRGLSLKAKAEKIKHEAELATPELETDVESESAEPEPVFSGWFLDTENDRLINSNHRKFFYDSVQKDVAPTSAFQVVEMLPKNYVNNTNFPLSEIVLSMPFSDYKEKYQLRLPKDEELNPFEEIGRSMEMTALTFLPEPYRSQVLNKTAYNECIVGRYILAFEKEDFDALLAEITSFNTLIDTLRDDKTILKNCSGTNEVSMVVLHEVLYQCYARTVAPYAKKLKQYKAFSNFVYGELLPGFLSQIFQQVGLSASDKFIDLGSGVGNCVIQAALECGCQSYGCEIMPNASDLCELQTKEFEARSRAWGLNSGSVVNFLRQGFEDNPEVKSIVDSCRVILVNNYLFDSDLNQKVVQLFRHLPPGTVIVSLKPIVPPGYTINLHDIECVLNRMSFKRYEYGDNSVSWTDKGGEYYISKVEKDIVEEYFAEHSSGRMRQRTRI